MKFIKKTDELVEIVSEVNSIIRRNETLPNRVFKEQFVKFLVISFDEIWGESFFLRINSIVSELNDLKWTFVTLNPDPKNFFSHFNKYPIFEVTLEDSYEDYFLVTRNEPEPNSDDALVYNMEIAVLYPTSQSWAIYADRDFELGILAFSNDKIMRKFRSVFGIDEIFTIKESIHELLEVIYSNNIVPEYIRVQLLNNYG